ncbi:hypothetical protein ODZ84_00485 [Chryseobacterium fluminis]|uniref:hypothetical protein n=1 Tax=Chryseobacterium fluminis TaxID=2983606 RepID=UPI002253013D|nr:hypothetical protein [Chryseobacterium sp. MMS21-Ot14]UZT98081.1 hypothetical protein ODZ84_00485 [Chryseobacterium sp. MMS21-Ot14]
MQGIEPKIHSNLTKRVEYYRFLLQKTDHPELHSNDAIAKASELCERYEEYLNNKKKLEKSIKEYREYHTRLRKLLTIKIRDLRKKMRAIDDQ